MMREARALRVSVGKVPAFIASVMARFTPNDLPPEFRALYDEVVQQGEIDGEPLPLEHLEAEAFRRAIRSLIVDGCIGDISNGGRGPILYYGKRWGEWPSQRQGRRRRRR